MQVDREDLAVAEDVVGVGRDDVEGPQQADQGAERSEHEQVEASLEPQRLPDVFILLHRPIRVPPPLPRADVLHHQGGRGGGQGPGGQLAEPGR